MANALRNDSVAINGYDQPSGLYVIGESDTQPSDIPRLPRLITPGNEPGIPEAFTDGDIVWLDRARGKLRTILSRLSNANTLLLTEQCENRCLFCSQPPNDKDDTGLYLNAALALLNFNTEQFVGLSGGEPTKNARGFINLLSTLRNFSNRTPLHILSHGRNFSDRAFCEQVARLLCGRSVLWGIPLYGHKATVHDQLVASGGAFAETTRGIGNLAAHGQAIEIRIIPTQSNLDHLAHIVSFIAANYVGVNIISIMNIEPKGWGRKNYRELYVPVRQQNAGMLNAVQLGTRYGFDIRLFNYPLCLLDEDLRRYSCRSISDWKNYYPDECRTCGARSACGGFFTSATGQFIESVEALS